VADEEKKAAEEPKAGAEAPKSKGRRPRSKHDGGKGKKDGGMMTKVIATVFGAVVAPILVAIGIAWLRPQPDPKPAPTQPGSPAPTTKPIREGILSLITPNLSDTFYTFTYDEELKENVPNDTVDPRLFKYEEKPKRMVVTGWNMNGKNRNVLLTTRRDDFEDYTLHLWYRWGPLKNTYGALEGKARRGTLLLHLTGPDGGLQPRMVWPQCISMHLGEVSCGSLRFQAHPGNMQGVARVKESPDRLRREYVGGDAKEFPQVSGEPEGWDGYLLRRDFPADVRFDSKNNLVRDGLPVAALVGGGPAAGSPDLFGEPLPVGYHPDRDPTIPKVSPPYEGNEWNVLRVDCIKDTVRVTINGKRVNEITGLNVKKGKIAINSALGEYEIGKLDVEFLKQDRPEKGSEKGR
jgi:hypothetical protein